MSEIGAADAARNNADWCDAMCGAHGTRGELARSHWLTRSPAPPGYPNLVTLEPAAAPALDAVRGLARVLLSQAWAVKDSFSVLPLEPAGFRLLFEAEWISGSPRPLEAREGGPWTRVRSEAALAAWEAAWGESASKPRVFLPALLARRDVAILGALGAEGEVAAGVVANRSAKVVGLSNFFARGERELLRAGCIEAARREFPGLPLVGYEAGQDLAGFRALGFASVGSLRVWLREAAAR